MDAEFLAAIDSTADTSFEATPAKIFGENLIAERRSGSERKGFLRPGERDVSIGPPFDILIPERPAYGGQPTGRGPTANEKRGAWQLQEEYVAGRLGKNDEENSRLWKTAKWIDKLYRIATIPADAVKSLNCFAGDEKDATDPDDWIEGFEDEEIIIDELDKEQLSIKLPNYDLVRLVDDLKECDDLARIDIDKLVRDAGPLPDRTDLPGPIERQEAIKILRMLMLGMGSLWHPVKLSIVYHATMKSLGKTQGVGDGVAATVGRQRVIEGLRLAESIRKRLMRDDRHVSMWLDRIRANQEVVSYEEWRLSNRYKLGSVDEIIRDVLAALPMPMPVSASPGHFLNQAAGPVIKLPDAANDNCDATARKAA